MIMKRVLIMCNSNPETDPRPNRMIHWLKDDYQLTVLGRNTFQLVGVESIALFSSSPGVSLATSDADAAGSVRGVGFRNRAISVSSAGKMLPSWVKKLITFVLKRIRYSIHILRIRIGRYEDALWGMLGRAKVLSSELARRDFDLIISHDCTLLPLACRIKKDSTPLMLDAREYYPRNFDDQWIWRMMIKPINLYLCNEYLHRCNKIITVSDGLAQEYAKHYHVQPEVIMSLPTAQDLRPVQAEGNAIKMVYHGNVNPSRRTELMIEMMDYVDERFSLDLMIMVSRTSYWQRIALMAKQRRNVRIIPPVPMQQIVPFTNQYDIGLFLCAPTNFNLTYTLPNKLFEFIQARLSVAIGPNIEMKKIVEKYDCGLVASDFQPQTLAKALNALTVDKIMYYKEQAHKAALELNAEANKRRIEEIINKLLSDGDIGSHQS